MLSQVNRLRRSTDFGRAIREGSRAASSTLVVHTRVVPDSTEPARVGFAVSRAVGGAVDRNLVKRRLRHAVRARIDDLPPGATVVVRANPAAAVAGWRRLEADLSRCLSTSLHRATSVPVP